MLALVELVGPCRFSHWDSAGNPVARTEPNAVVQVAAVSLEQTSNTRDLFPAMIPHRTRQAFNLDVQKEIIYANGGRQKLKMVSSSFRSAEGNRPTFLILNETHHFIPSQGGKSFYETLTNNLAKTKGRLLCITNAYEPSEQSVAQDIREAQEKVWAGMAPPSGWLYDSLEAHPDAPLDPEWTPYILETIRGDATWLDVKTIMEEILDGSKSASRKRRMWFNQIVATEDGIYSPGEWDAIRRAGCRGTKADLNPGDKIVMGFDGGKTDDATALIAIRASDRLVVPLAIWQRPEGMDKWEINRWHVDSEVNEAFANYDVQAFFCDRALWESYIDKWRDEHGDRLLVKASGNHSMILDMAGNKAAIAAGHESLMAHVLDKKISHNGDRLLRIHALNAVRHHNGAGIVPFKEAPESPKKIDAYVATLLAFMALEKLLESRKEREPTYDNTLYMF
jgi:phage terminase large subunit-like protein